MCVTAVSDDETVANRNRFVLVAVGLLWPWLTKLALGRLPGDIVINRGNFGFYFPIVTCLIVSVVLWFILWLFNR